MISRIYKYAILVGDTVAVDLPQGALPLTVQMQGDTPQMWALVDPTAPREQHIFHVRGTGHDVDSEEVGAYIGTFQMYGGRAVFHLFEGK